MTETSARQHIGDTPMSAIEETLEERLLHAAKGDRVRIDSVANEAQVPLVGCVGEVRAVDAGDPRLTFLVAVESENLTPEQMGVFGRSFAPVGSPTLWVHDVQKYEPPEETDAERIDQLTSLVASLRTRLAEVEQLRREDGNRFDAKLEEIGRAAKDLAVEHDWCSVVRDKMAELGVPWPEDRWTFVVTVEYEVTATRSGDSREPSESFIESSIATNELDLDNDWDDVEVNVASVSASQVEQA